MQFREHLNGVGDMLSGHTPHSSICPAPPRTAFDVGAVDVKLRLGEFTPDSPLEEEDSNRWSPLKKDEPLNNSLADR
jgi:hypothetical protein